MKILICDDNATIAGELKCCIEEKYGDEVRLTVCGGVEEFKRTSKDDTYDLAFIDIILGDGNGIEAVNEMRRLIPDMKVIFITAHVREFAEDIFVGVPPYGYIGKPIIHEKVWYYIDRLMDDLRMESGVFRAYRGKQAIEIPFGEIVRFESSKRKVNITCVNDTVEIYDKMDDLEKSLDGRFVRCHQSFIVNADYVSDFSGEMLTMKDGEEISITRKYRQSARQSYFRYKGKNIL